MQPNILLYGLKQKKGKLATKINKYIYIECTWTININMAWINYVCNPIEHIFVYCNST